jgi:DNA-binding response OmpR family regulator
VKSNTGIRKIIMVDDEPDVNITIKTVLENTGLFLVDIFNNAEMNGFQLCRKLREIDKKLKICLLTATELYFYYKDTDSDVINDLGTDCFVSKPVNTTDLVNRFKVILS